MRDPLFIEFSEKWMLDYDAVHVIYMIVSFSHRYTKTSQTLNKLGIQLSPRQLKYFCRKIELTQQYKSEKHIGLKNYRKLVLRRS